MATYVKQHAEDAVHVSGDLGILSLAVRSDFGAASGANGDYVNLPVAESSSIAGLAVHIVGDDDKYVRGSQAHDAAQVGGPVAIGAFAKATAPTVVTTDRITNLWADLNGRLRITGDSLMTPLIITGDSVAGSPGAGVLSVQNAATAALFVRGAIAHDAADSGSNPVKIGGFASTTAPTAVTANDVVNLWADLNGRLRITGDASMSALLTQGDIAHDAGDSGNPVKMGMKAIVHGANPTAVTANDRTHWYANRHGVPWVIGGHPNIITAEVLASGSAQTNVALVTVATGLKIVVTQIMVMLDGDVTVKVAFRIGFATATTPTTTGVILSHPGFGQVGAGGFLSETIVSRGDGSGIIGVGADDEDLRITSTVATGGTLRVVVSYYTIES